MHKEYESNKSSLAQAGQRKAVVDVTTGLPTTPSRTKNSLCRSFFLLAIFVATVHVSLAGTIGGTRQRATPWVKGYYWNVRSGGSRGAIKDPYNPEDYMRDLAARFRQEEGRNTLLKGLKAREPNVLVMKPQAVTAEQRRREFVQDLERALARLPKQDGMGKYRTVDATRLARVPPAFRPPSNRDRGYNLGGAVSYKENDGDPPLWHMREVREEAGYTLVQLKDGAYSVADVVTLNYLPDLEKEVYYSSIPILRPLVFTGRTLVGSWKMLESTGNMLTWGYFDNLTTPAGTYIKSITSGS